VSATATTAATTKYLVVEEAADLLRMSVRALHERTRHRTVPMRKLANSRKLLFVESELHDFMNGAELEVVEKADGSILVKPIAQAVAA
jgi:hypothetical protein